MSLLQPQTQSVTVFTIGHSTRTFAEFGALLSEAKVEAIVDVRSTPRSRTNPQFSIDSLPGSLAELGIGYQHVPELGGRRHRARSAPPSPNTFWVNEAFRSYADYAATDAFSAGFATLQGLAHRSCCAIMCSEALWWRCHRRIISDYLLAQGTDVLHILGPHKTDPAILTPNARRLSNGKLIYPA
jgi:uncharacterized protein (DUF488 family)